MPSNPCPECQQYVDEIYAVTLQISEILESSRRQFSGNSVAIAAMEACAKEVRKASDHLEDLLWQYGEHKKVHEGQGDTGEEKR